MHRRNSWITGFITGCRHQIHYREHYAGTRLQFLVDGASSASTSRIHYREHYAGFITENIMQAPDFRAHFVLTSCSLAFYGTLWVPLGAQGCVPKSRLCRCLADVPLTCGIMFHNERHHYVKNALWLIQYARLCAYMCIYVHMHAMRKCRAWALAEALPGAC